MQYIKIVNGCEVRIENSVPKVTVRILPRDAERQLARVTECSIRTEQPLWILFLAYISFDNCIALFYKFNAKISTFAVKKCSVRPLYSTLTLRRFAKNDVKTDLDDLTSCTRVFYIPMQDYKNL